MKSLGTIKKQVSVVLPPSSSSSSYVSEDLESDGTNDSSNSDDGEKKLSEKKSEVRSRVSMLRDGGRHSSPTVSSLLLASSVLGSSSPRKGNEPPPFHQQLVTVMERFGLKDAFERKLRQEEAKAEKIKRGKQHEQSYATFLEGIPSAAEEAAADPSSGKSGRRPLTPKGLRLLIAREEKKRSRQAQQEKLRRQSPPTPTVHNDIYRSLLNDVVRDHQGGQSPFDSPVQRRGGTSTNGGRSISGHCVATPLSLGRVPRADVGLSPTQIYSGMFAVSPDISGRQQQGLVLHRGQLMPREISDVSRTTDFPADYSLVRRKSYEEERREGLRRQIEQGDIIMKRLVDATTESVPTREEEKDETNADMSPMLSKIASTASLQSSRNDDDGARRRKANFSIQLSVPRKQQLRDPLPATAAGTTTQCNPTEAQRRLILIERERAKRRRQEYLEAVSHSDAEITAVNVPLTILRTVESPSAKARHDVGAHRNEVKAVMATQRLAAACKSPPRDVVRATTPSPTPRRQSNGKRWIVQPTFEVSMF